MLADLETGQKTVPCLLFAALSLGMGAEDLAACPTGQGEIGAIAVRQGVKDARDQLFWQLFDHCALAAGDALSLKLR